MNSEEYKKLWNSVGCEISHPTKEQIDPTIWSEENRIFISENGVPTGPVFSRYIEFSGIDEFERNETEKKVYLSQSSFWDTFFDYGCSEIMNFNKDSGKTEIIARNIGQLMLAQARYNATNLSLLQEIESLNEQQINTQIKDLKEMILNEIGFESEYWNYLIFCLHHEASNYPKSSVIVENPYEIPFENDEFEDLEYEPEDA